MITFSQFISEKTILAYRGIKGEYSDKIAKSKGITWVTQDKEYAKKYSDGKHLYQFRVNIRNPFNFMFRTLQVHVKLEDMIDRILVKLDDMNLPNSKLEKIDSIIEKLEKKDTGKMKKVWEWWTELPELKQILELAGFDSITAYEGTQNDVKTYGIFSQNSLKPIK